MATNITSAPTILGGIYALTYSLSWSGTSPVGSVSIQGSNDFSLNSNGTVANAGTWNTLTVGLSGSAVSSIAITGNTGTGIIDVTATGLYAIRLIYTATSGTGNLTVVINGKSS